MFKALIIIGFYTLLFILWRRARIPTDGLHRSWVKCLSCDGRGAHVWKDTTWGSIKQTKCIVCDGKPQILVVSENQFELLQKEIELKRQRELNEIEAGDLAIGKALRSSLSALAKGL